MTIARTLKPFFLSTLPFIFIFSCIFSLAGAVMHDVDVGPGASLAFEPKSVDASPGDVINFILWALLLFPAVRLLKLYLSPIQ